MKLFVVSGKHCFVVDLHSLFLQPGFYPSSAMLPELWESRLEKFLFWLEKFHLWLSTLQSLTFCPLIDLCGKKKNEASQMKFERCTNSWV